MNTPKETKMEPLLSFPFNSFLMLRLEYVLILQDELQAKLLRIIEAYVETQRQVIYRNQVNKNQAVNVPKDIFVPISYKLFMNDLYDTVTSENTIKKALKQMIDFKIIFKKPPAKKKYAAPEYKINTDALQILLDVLKIQGYQKLIPSILDTLKNSYPQDLIPSWYQKLIPSNPNSSSEENSRVSTVDTTIRLEEDYVGKNESPESSSSPSSALSVSLQDIPIQDIIAEVHRRELEQLSTPDVDKVDPPVEKQANGVEQSSSHIANETTHSQPSTQRNTEPLVPPALSGEAQRIDGYWQQLGFISRPSAKKHWLTLSKHVQSFEDMQSLYNHTESQILKDPALDDKTVNPGNLTNAKYLDGWKQKKRRTEQPKQESKPYQVRDLAADHAKMIAEFQSSSKAAVN
jgi:hypothetical protein